VVPCLYSTRIRDQRACAIGFSWSRLCCSMGFTVLVMCGLRRLNAQIKRTSRLTAAVPRVCVATLLLSHACRSVVRNSVWHDRQSLFTYVTVRFAYAYECFQCDAERRAVSLQQLSFLLLSTAVQFCLSAHPYFRLSRPGIVSKRLDISSYFFQLW